MEFTWSAPDGLALPCERWNPENSARGVVIGVPGLGGAATDFISFAAAATRAGFAVFSPNLRGQGRDPRPGQRGAELDLPRLVADLSAFGEQAAAAFPGLPIFWCGESMGSLLVAHFLASGKFLLPVRGVIFSVPVVDLIKPTPAIVRQTLHLLARVVPHLRLNPSLFVSGKAEQLLVTRDPDHPERLRASPHYIPIFTLRFLDAFGDLMLSSPRLAADVKVPTLVLAAGQDVFIRIDQIQAWFDLLPNPDKELHVYPEAYHLLWNDFDREQVLADILSWLDRQTNS